MQGPGEKFTQKNSAKSIACVRSCPIMSISVALLILPMVKERASAEEIVQLLTQRGAIYQAEPVRTMVYAEYLAKAGFIKPIPKSWKLLLPAPARSRGKLNRRSRCRIGITIPCERVSSDSGASAAPSPKGGQA